MATVKVFGRKTRTPDEKKNYKNADALEKVVHYIFRENMKDEEDLIPELSGGYGVDLSSTRAIIDDMQMIKAIYGKTDGRQLRHFSVNLSVDETAQISDLKEFAYEVCGYYGKEYQTVFVGHRKIEDGRERIHFHVCCNSVSYETGEKMSMRKGSLQEFKNFVNAKVQEYGVMEEAENRQDEANQEGE
ncbi:Relaxase/Mobilisation nuclease domain [[Clostridium] cf. saccharolyticum K10]|nr:Relaxase/Mobilisation nuclease domain [[Clostridium] cf. saccharolyticum K10]